MLWWELGRCSKLSFVVIFGSSSFSFHATTMFHLPKFHPFDTSKNNWPCMWYFIPFPGIPSTPSLLTFSFSIFLSISKKWYFTKVSSYKYVESGNNCKVICTTTVGTYRHPPTDFQCKGGTNSSFKYDVILEKNQLCCASIFEYIIFKCNR